MILLELTLLLRSHLPSVLELDVVPITQQNVQGVFRNFHALF